jgi:predicted component of type VI protein secretion system
MMKKVAFLSATVAMLILSGCSSKEPAIDATANAIMLILLARFINGNTKQSAKSRTGTDS